MSIGKAPRESEPVATKINAFGDGEDGADGPNEAAEAALDAVEDEKSDAGPIVRKKEKQAYKPRAEAFKDFKQEDGKALEENIKDSRKELKEKKDEMKVLKEQCNRAKNEIDSLKVRLEHKTDQKQKSLDLDDEEDVIDEEEFNLIKEMKEFKRSYRESYDKLKRLKADVFLIQ